MNTDCQCPWGSRRAHSDCKWHGKVAVKQFDQEGAFHPEDQSGPGMGVSEITLTAPRVVEIWRTLSATPGGSPIGQWNADDLTPSDISRMIQHHIQKQRELYKELEEVRRHLRRYESDIEAIRRVFRA